MFRFFIILFLLFSIEFITLFYIIWRKSKIRWSSNRSL